ncbi:fimbrial protein [Obesumbacterium proteus]|uniref:SfmH family fimbriae-like adhesin protein n=1 Tax=Obesumbacterium proteus ATCC 12841 TaxID=1354268 RepID=A0AA91ECQ1_9GAMM|nr:fimbrial protein [Obesumbacterium proteus]AMO82938.1 fimbrial protein [Obesumbacterium proteus]OAT58153.1 SfmH family fimbriae-like adhesin protein [Obesumbacterium proteus ATCC 12841]
MQNNELTRGMNRVRMKILFGLLALFPIFTQAATTVLQGCFSTLADYAININTEIPSAQNRNGNTINISDHIIGEGPSITANCACPRNLYSNTIIYESTAAGSPLPPGRTGYGYLTEHLDIDITGYTNSINSSDGSGLQPISISTYPTPFSSMAKVNDSLLKPTEGTDDVCSDATRPTGGSTTKRGFKWNVIGLSIYVKAAILGEEIIPSTIVAQNYSCLAMGNYCSLSDTNQVSNIRIAGKITAPLTCTINAGSTIEVELGDIVTSQFVAQGQPPASYTLKNVDISYHCDDPAAANAGKIKFSLSADQGVVPDSNNLIASMLNRNDVGVRMYDKSGNDIVLDGSLDLPVTLDTQGNGKISMDAAPVSTTSNRPQPGKFEGNVTVKMELR